MDMKDVQNRIAVAISRHTIKTDSRGEARRCSCGQRLWGIQWRDEPEAAQHVASEAASWLATDIERATDDRNKVIRIEEFADQLALESPKPGPGGFIAESIRAMLKGPSE